MMESCGVLDHDNDCLCDVVIPHPTGWVDDAIQDMWMGQEIARLMNYEQDWTDATILEYLSDLVYAKDNWAGAVIQRDLLESASVGCTVDAQTRKSIRNKLIGGLSITSVMDELGLDIDELNHVLFTSRRFMPLDELVRFEECVLNQTYPNPNSLGAEFGMSYQSASSLASYWPKEFTGKAVPEYNNLIDRLLAEQPSLTNVAVAKLVNDELSTRGMVVSITPSKVSNRRHYLKRKRKKNK